MNVSPIVNPPRVTEHRCHLERLEDGPLNPARSVCTRGWVGLYRVVGAVAVEDGTGHMTAICSTCGRVSLGPVGAAAHRVICASRRGVSVGA